MSYCYYEKKLRLSSETALPISDLIIRRGIGVFESIRTYGGKPFALARHLERLQTSAENAGILHAGALQQKIAQAIGDVFANGALPFEETLINPYITGGDDNVEGTYPNPRFFVAFSALPAPEDDLDLTGIALEPTDVARPHPGVKSVNYLFGNIPRIGVRGVMETLYCPGGEITESATSNFFLVKDGALVTAPADRVLQGITRQIVFEIAREAGLPIEERVVRTYEIEEAEEAFITGSIKEIVSVVRIGGTRIRDGSPGPVTKKLRELFHQAIPKYQ